MPAALKMRMNILLFMANVEIKITTSLRVRFFSMKNVFLKFLINVMKTMTIIMILLKIVSIKSFACY